MVTLIRIKMKMKSEIERGYKFKYYVQNAL